MEGILISAILVASLSFYAAGAYGVFAIIRAANAVTRFVSYYTAKE